MEIKDIIKEMAEKCLPESEFFIVDVKITGKANQQKVLVVMDGDQGISIDNCADLSRRLGEELDTTELLPGAFHLEVSSPGADETIKNTRQYAKNKGRRFEIVNEEDEVIIGKLEAINETGLVIEPEVKKKKGSSKDKKEEPILLEIPFSKIKKSNVIISFK
jgi:ribosome maturation factor RimP